MFHDDIMLIATCFGCTLYYFYAFSGTNLLTRCKSASSVFSTDPTRKISSKSGEIFSSVNKRSGSFPSPEGTLHPRRARPHPRPRPHGVWAPGGSPQVVFGLPEASRCYMFGGKDFPRFWRYFLCRYLKGSYGHLEGGGWIGATPNFNSFSDLGLTQR